MWLSDTLGILVWVESTTGHRSSKAQRSLVGLDMIESVIIKQIFGTDGSMAEHTGKIVIVTGGGLGIGAGTALEFARQGANVTIADVDIAAAQEVVRNIESIGTRGLAVQADVCRSADCQRVVNETVEEFGGVDVLFSNVGIQPAESYANVENTTEETWDKILCVNLKSRFLMAKFAIPEMRKRGGGVIISSSSTQGLQSQQLVPAYAASKGGDISLTRQMALDYASDNIRVLTICPGAIDTGMLRSRMMGIEGEARLKRSIKRHPIGRIGTTLDVGQLVTFLASDKASFMTGEYICIDGGMMAKGAWA